MDILNPQKGLICAFPSENRWFKIPIRDGRRSDARASARIQTMKKTLLLSVSLWFVTLMVGALAVIAADFGASAWVFVMLLAWLLTVGLPTTFGVVTVVSLWSGGGLGAFLAVAAGVGFLFQTGAVGGSRRLWAYRRARTARSPA